MISLHLVKKAMKTTGFLLAGFLFTSCDQLSSEENYELVKIEDDVYLFNGVTGETFLRRGLELIKLESPKIPITISPMAVTREKDGFGVLSNKAKFTVKYKFFNGRLFYIFTVQDIQAPTTNQNATGEITWESFIKRNIDSFNLNFTDVDGFNLKTININLSKDLTSRNVNNNSEVEGYVVESYAYISPEEYLAISNLNISFTRK